MTRLANDLCNVFEYQVMVFLPIACVWPRSLHCDRGVNWFFCSFCYTECCRTDLNRLILNVHLTVGVVHQTIDVETALHSFQVTAVTPQHKPFLLKTNPFISWTRNMVAEFGCKQVGSSGCRLEYWPGLLTLQPLVCSFSMFVWFPICWRSNVSHQRNGNNEKDRDRIPHRPAEYEQCLRTLR